LKDQQLVAAASSSPESSSAVCSISRSTDALLAGVSAALKKVPMPNYTNEEVSCFIL
jgi:hypothetical protein